MNERIRELAEQAGITTNLDTDYYEKDMNKWVDYFSEKFAELIAQECLTNVRLRHTQALDQNWNADEALNAVEGDIVRGFQINEF